MGLADEGEDNKEHCHQGEWLKKVGGNADQWGQTQSSPHPSHVQKDAGCIGGLHISDGVDLTSLLVRGGQFDQLIGESSPVSAMSARRLGTAGNTGSHPTANPPALPSSPPRSLTDPQSLLIGSLPVSPPDPYGSNQETPCEIFLASGLAKDPPY